MVVADEISSGFQSSKQNDICTEEFLISQSYYRNQNIFKHPIAYLIIAVKGAFSKLHFTLNSVE